MEHHGAMAPGTVLQWEQNFHRPVPESGEKVLSDETDETWELQQ